MAKVIILDSDGAGTSSDELTATSSDVVKGLTAVTKDSDDVLIVGTMDDLSSDSSIDSVVNDSNGINIRIKPGVYRQNGEKYISYGDELNAAIGMNVEKILKGTIIAGQAGTLDAQSISNFNLSLYSSGTVMGAWQNPTNGPYSGVKVVYRTDRYPSGPDDRTTAYEGSGISFTKSLPVGVKHYFSAFSYMTTNFGRIYSSTFRQSEFTTTTVQGRQAFKSNGTFAVPTGVRSVQVFLVGGGGGGAGRYGVSNRPGKPGGSAIVIVRWGY